MIKLKEPILYCDVDDTLVSWEGFGNRIGADLQELRDLGFTEFRDPHTGEPYFLKPINATIEQLKRHKLCGHTIVVWSAGGAEWAEKVVKTLKLESLVDAVASKPDWYLDDIPASEFMPNSIRRDMRQVK